MTNIILASKSPYRKKLLSQIIDHFITVDSQLDESVLKGQINDPLVLPLLLSEKKARNVFREYPNDVIIGSDQICLLKKEILGKPKTIEKAIESLMKLQGQAHQLITSYTILFDSQCIQHTNTTTLKMRNLTEANIKKYINADMPLDCAGSYKLEQKGISLFESIATDDHTAIIGLPLIQLNTDLMNLGILE